MQAEIKEMSIENRSNYFLKHKLLVGRKNVNYWKKEVKKIIIKKWKLESKINLYIIFWFNNFYIIWCFKLY